MSLLRLLDRPPPLWPRFRSPLRSTAVTARLGRLVGICFTICFVTGMLSYYQYQPWSWLPEPATPVWLFRLTQGLHVATGTATIPLLLVKLWSVYPKLFQWPPAKSIAKAGERLSVAVLVSSALLELFTGLFNSMDWYPWPWGFVTVHRFLAYVVIGSILLHVAIKLPDIKYGLRKTPADPPATTGISRRGLFAATGAGVGIVVATSVGETLTPLQPIDALAIRQPDKGPQGVPVNKLASQAGVTKSATDPAWRLTVIGPAPYDLSIDDVLAMVSHEAHLPIACVEGWSVGAHWQGLRLIDVVRRAGGDGSSRVRVDSLQQHGAYKLSYVDGPQVEHALLATHLNGERLDIDHGYPLRLIAPNRAGVLNTKWLTKVEIL